ICLLFFFFFQAEDGIRDDLVTGVQTCALPILLSWAISPPRARSASRTATSSTGRATSSDRSTSGTRPSRASASRAHSRPSPATRSEERRVGKEWCDWVWRCRGEEYESDLVDAW